MLRRPLQGYDIHTAIAGVKTCLVGKYELVGSPPLWHSGFKVTNVSHPLTCTNSELEFRILCLEGGVTNWEHKGG